MHTREDVEALVSSVGFWWHSIDLGGGVQTRGEKTPATLARELASLCLPELRGRSVLDIGAYDGFYSFEAERRGAERVVALDHYVWSLDLPAHIAYWRDCRKRGILPLPNEKTPHWQPATLPGKRGFDTAHTILNSSVEPVVGDFMTMDLDSLGTFDVTFFLGVLYHLEDPLGALRRLAAVTGEVAIIETHAVVIPGYEEFELCQFYSANQLNGDVSNWWGPNSSALIGMCQAAGFSRAEVVSGYLSSWAADDGWSEKLRGAARRAYRLLALKQPFSRRPRHFRAVVHAWK